MKIILLQNVPKVGHKYDIKDVAAGYARNFLLARGLAELATPKTIKEIEQRRDEQRRTGRTEREQLEKSIDELSGREVLVAAKADEKGSLFAGIGAKEISKAIVGAGFGAVPPEYIILDTPIKKTGVYPIVVQAGEKRGEVVVKVMRV